MMVLNAPKVAEISVYGIFSEIFVQVKDKSFGFHFYDIDFKPARNRRCIAKTCATSLIANDFMIEVL